MSRNRIVSNGKPTTTTKTRQKITQQPQQFKNLEYSFRFAFNSFHTFHEGKGSAPATITFYENFYKKYCKYIEEAKSATDGVFNVDWLADEEAQNSFVKWLRESGLNQQTINSYLRGYRAFGKFCLKKNYISRFECPISEKEPPAKEVYTEKEIKALLKKPKEENNFEEFRNYCIIELMLATGARCNTILNIQLCDVELEEGYITFNTTKTGRVARLGLEPRIRKDLATYIHNYRTRYYDVASDDWREYSKEDFLFPNGYNEQLTRGGLSKAIAAYNQRRGVEKTSIHLFRHTFGKYWVMSGGDCTSLAKALTHNSIQMAQRYTNLYSEDIKREIEQHSVLSQIRKTSGRKTIA